MNSNRWIAWPLLLCAVCTVCVLAKARADEPPVIRYTTYVLVEVGGKPTQVAMESRAYGAMNKDYTYKDRPSFAVISAKGDTLDEVDGKMGETTTLNIPASAGDFALIEAKPGNNYCVARPEGAYGFVATETAPMNTVRGFEREYFFVPKGVDAASIFLHAFSVNEAARVLIYDPDGKVAYEGEDDFNEPAAVSFQVMEGQDGKVWSLSLVPPKNPNWKIDDCKVWLSGGLPGILSPRPEWAERLSRPFVVSWRRVYDFEGENPVATLQWDRSPTNVGFNAALSAEQAHSGKQSLRIEMNLPEGVTVGNQLKIFTKPLKAEKLEQPGAASRQGGRGTAGRNAVPADSQAALRCVKFWLYGDGSKRKLTVRVRDQDGEHHYVNAGAITWKGWGEVVADFTQGDVRSSGGDGNKRIDGPMVSLVIQIGHEQGHPAHSVYYVDDLAVSP